MQKEKDHKSDEHAQADDSSGEQDTLLHQSVSQHFYLSIFT